MAITIRPSFELSRYDNRRVRVRSTNKVDAAHGTTRQPFGDDSRKRMALALVELCAKFMENTWPSRVFRLPFRQFIFEVIKRSRVHYSVFQVALCYISRMKPVIEQLRKDNKEIPQRIACGRRVLVAALQIATKYVQDRCYSVQVWSRISGLSVKDLTANELALMQALDWNMFVPYEVYLKSCNWLKDAAHSQGSYLSPPVCSVQDQDQDQHQPLQLLDGMHLPPMTGIHIEMGLGNNIVPTNDHHLSLPVEHKASLQDNEDCMLTPPTLTSDEPQTRRNSDASSPEIEIWSNGI